MANLPCVRGILRVPFFIEFVFRPGLFSRRPGRSCLIESKFVNLFNINKQLSTHGARLEKWIGKEQAAAISKSMERWYGGPIAIAGVPGNVFAHKGGDFRGPIRSGQFICAKEFVKMRAKSALQRFGHKQRTQLNAGFASLSDLIAEATTGKARYFMFNKLGTGGSATASNSLWRLGTQPPVGTAPAAAPGGTVFTDASTGAFPFTNPGGGDTQHFVKGEVSTTIAANTLLLYDLLFGCLKTMNSTATEAVTGVPTRYQSITSTDMDYAGGNFLFIQAGGTSLAAGAHNWTVCTYLDQGGNASTLPSIAGITGQVTDRLDQPLGTWFAPLEAGDTGIQALTQMQCSALIATGEIWFMIGHPIAFMPCPVANQICQLDGIMTAFNLVRIFDDAALAFLEVTKPTTGTASYTGQWMSVSG